MHSHSQSDAPQASASRSQQGNISNPRSNSNPSHHPSSSVSGSSPSHRSQPSSTSSLNPFSDSLTAQMNSSQQQQQQPLSASTDVPPPSYRDTFPDGVHAPATPASGSYQYVPHPPMQVPIPQPAVAPNSVSSRGINSGYPPNPNMTVNPNMYIPPNANVNALGIERCPNGKHMYKVHFGVSAFFARSLA